MLSVRITISRASCCMCPSPRHHPRFHYIPISSRLSSRQSLQLPRLLLLSAPPFFPSSPSQTALSPLTIFICCSMFHRATFNRYYPVLIILALIVGGYVFIQQRRTNHIFVVSLDRALDRRKWITQQMRDIPHTIFSAVDGFNLTSFQQQLMYRYIDSDALTPGEIGCFLSHITLWWNIIHHHYDCTLILEDDANVTEALPHLVNSFCRLKSYDLLYLGHCRERLNTPLVQTINGYELRASKRALCTRGYIITYSGARILINLLEHEKQGQPVDNFMRLLFRRNLGVALSVFPPPVTVAKFGSLIGERGKDVKRNRSSG